MGDDDVDGYKMTDDGESYQSKPKGRHQYSVTLGPKRNSSHSVFGSSSHNQNNGKNASHESVQKDLIKNDELMIQDIWFTYFHIW